MVKYTSKNTENEGDTTGEKSSEETNSSKITGSEPSDENDGSNVTTKTLSFWTVIGLGSVIKAPTGTSGAMVKGPRSEPSGSKGSISRSSSGSNRSTTNGSKS